MEALKRLRILFICFREFWCDFIVYTRFSSTLGETNRMHVMARIVANTHVLEKGLAFNSTDRVFGTVPARNLIAWLEKYGPANDSSDQIHLNSAYSVLSVYFTRVSAMKGFPLELFNSFKEIHDKNWQIQEQAFGGVTSCSREETFKSAAGSYAECVSSRRSIRSFVSGVVDLDTIKKAVALATYSPSVCNRQSISVHVIQSPKLIRDHLALQSGNRGFGESVSTLLIVVANLSAFSSANERNAPFVDGGIFCMSLLNALHYHQLASVPLNWCVPQSVDHKCRKLGVVKDFEVIISFIGVGRAPAEYTVPKATRLPVDSVIKVH